MNYSLLVTAYNEEALLPQVLEALNAQTVKPLTKLLVDDVSTDSTPDIGRENGFIVYRKTPPKSSNPYENRAKAFNTGITNLIIHEKGDCILKVDSDIIVPLDYAEKLLTAFENPKVGVASGVSIEYINKRFISNGAVMYRAGPLHYAPVEYGWDRRVALNIIRKGYLPYINPNLKYIELRPPRYKKPPTLLRVICNRIEMMQVMKGKKIILASQDEATKRMKQCK